MKLFYWHHGLMSFNFPASFGANRTVTAGSKDVASTGALESMTSSGGGHLGCQLQRLPTDGFLGGGGSLKLRPARVCKYGWAA